MSLLLSLYKIKVCRKIVQIYEGVSTTTHTRIAPIGSCNNIGLLSGLLYLDTIYIPGTRYSSSIPDLVSHNRFDAI